MYMGDTMNYSECNKTKDRVSLLGFGCMRFPTSNGKINVEEAVEMIKYAVENGVNYLDTAYPYHGFKSESFLGDYILNQDFARDVKVATKMPIYLVRKSSDFESYFNKQYNKLKIETIDFYLLHAINRGSFEHGVDLGVIEFLEQKKLENKIKNIGFSFHGKLEDFKFIIDSYDWDFCQIQLNIIDEKFQAGIEGLMYAYERGISVIIMEPLRGGSLVHSLPKDIENLYKSSSHQYSNVEWALKYLFDKKEVMCVLSGMSNIEQVKDNVRIANESDVGCLSDEDKRLLHEVKEIYHKQLEVKCTACNYCVDCPVKIDIPLAFQTLNSYKLYNKKSDIALYAQNVGYNSDTPKWTTTCIDCGKCESHCPQDLEIRKEFFKVQSNIETKPIRFFVKVARFIMGKNRNK